MNLVTFSLMPLYDKNISHQDAKTPRLMRKWIKKAKGKRQKAKSSMFDVEYV